MSSAHVSRFLLVPPGLFQDAMVVAWRRLDECDLDQPFGPWLRGIASRLVLAHYRKQKTAPVMLHDAVLHVVDRYFENISLLAGDTWDDKVAALRECIDALPTRQKSVIGGRYFDGLSVAEVAERFELSLEACKKRIQRGRTMLAVRTGFKLLFTRRASRTRKTHSVRG